jgi:hypothetical protein
MPYHSGMTAPRIHNAKANGGEIKKSVAKNIPAAGADEIEVQLERILARVPPLLTLPKPKARCPYTNKSRTGLVELIAPCERNNFKPPVKAIYKRAHKYAQRGQWLIPSENLFRHLLGLAELSTVEYLATVKARAEAKKENKS